MCSFIAFVLRMECQASRISLCRHADDLSTISIIGMATKTKKKKLPMH